MGPHAADSEAGTSKSPPEYSRRHFTYLPMRSLPRARLAESAPAISDQGPEAETDAYHFAEATWAPSGRADGEAERVDL